MPSATEDISCQLEKLSMKSSPGIAVIEVLLNEISGSKFTTVHRFQQNMEEILDKLANKTDCQVCVRSSGKLLLQYITDFEMDQRLTNEEICQRMVERGRDYLEEKKMAGNVISTLSRRFIHHNARILVHSYSNTLLESLKGAWNSGVLFTVFVAQPPHGKLSCISAESIKSIDSKIPVIEILDSAVGYIMEKIDMVFFGAEGVVESGGIINRIGTFTIAMCASSYRKPVYVFAESFKFIRLFPLSQSDIPNEYRYRKADIHNGQVDHAHHPVNDYTPPGMITLIFTDLGVFTPSAISDELIQKYN